MKKILSLVISACMLLMCVPFLDVPVKAALSGSGTDADPYLIDNASQLSEITLNNTNVVYKIIADIGPVTATIGTSATSGQFKGKLYGDKGNTCSGITGIEGAQKPTVELAIDSSSLATKTYQGLFAYVNTGTIENIIISGSVTGQGYVGGLAGRLQSSTVKNCVNTATITNSSANNAGGITGYTAGAGNKIENCLNTGTITNSVNSTGGIVGFQSVGTVSKCINIGTITTTGTGTNTGGLVGANYDTVEKSFNIGNVSGYTPVGGICGSLDTTSVVENNYNAGTVTASTSGGNGYAAGIAYTGSSATIRYNYNIGNAYGNNPVATVGNGSGTVANNYYLSTLTGIGTPLNSTALTAEEMRIQSNFTGFDFSTIWEWDNNGYDHYFPSLQGNKHLEKLAPLATPVITNVEKRSESYFLTFPAISNALKYDARIVHDNTPITLSSSGATNEIDITSALTENGNYSITVKAVADKSTYLNSPESTPLSYDYSGGIEFALPDLTGLAFSYEKSPEKYILSWDTVSGAESYVVKVGGGADNNTTALTYDITSLVSAPYGEYTVSVKAVGSSGESRPSEIDVCSYYGGGDGNQNPYKIYTIRHLNNVYRNNSSAFEQMNDITEPFETPIAEFSGTYKGVAGSRKVINLNIRSNADNVGFIRVLAPGGAIENIEAQGTVTAYGGSNVSYVAAFVGNNETNTASIINCANKAEVINETKGNYTAGIIANTQSALTLKDCENYGNISSAGNYVGGISGYSRGTVENCENRGSLTGGNYVGGIAGANYGLITKSKNLHPLTSVESNYVGGIAGTSVRSTGGGESITECFNAANVIGKDGVGGLSGISSCNSDSNKISFKNSYNSGEVYGDSNAGGLIGRVGYADRTSIFEIINCYDAQGKSMNMIGGKLDSTTNTISDPVYYYLDDGVTNTTGFYGTKKTDSELKALTATLNTPNSVWKDGTGGYLYPQLTNNEHIPKISGVKDTLVLITVSESGGTVTPSGRHVVIEGETFSITAVPTPNYSTDIKFNGAPVVTGNIADSYEYLSPAINAHSSIAVEFVAFNFAEPVLLKSDCVYDSYDSVVVEIPNAAGDGTISKEIFGPKGITFARIWTATEYVLKEYGMLFSKISAPAETLDDNLDVRRIQAKTEPNQFGQYGILFYGKGLEAGTEYYARAYSVYDYNGQEVVFYADPVTFTPSGPPSDD